MVYHYTVICTLIHTKQKFLLTFPVNGEKLYVKRFSYNGNCNLLSLVTDNLTNNLYKHKHIILSNSYHETPSKPLLLLITISEAILKFNETKPISEVRIFGNHQWNRLCRVVAIHWKNWTNEMWKDKEFEHQYFQCALQELSTDRIKSTYQFIFIFLIDRKVRKCRKCNWANKMKEICPHF